MYVCMYQPLHTGRKGYNIYFVEKFNEFELTYWVEC